MARPTTAHVAQNFEIETASGRYLDLSAPSPDAITLEDISLALARTCRFGGHCRRFYSVAEHAVRVARKLRQHGLTMYALAGLHHDDAEAYLGDIPRPLKPLLGETYQRLTIDVDDAIWQAIGRGYWWPQDYHAPAVKAADEWMLAVEARALLPSRGEGWQLGPLEWPIADWDDLGWDPAMAAGMFVAEHKLLIAEGGGEHGA